MRSTSVSARWKHRPGPGAGHIVYMPAHTYHRIGLYEKSLEANRRALKVGERCCNESPSDPIYRCANHPHNIHFILVSAQMGGDAKTTLEAVAKLDASLPLEVVKSFAFLEPAKGSPYCAHAQFTNPDTILKLAAPPKGLALVAAMHHYARAGAFAARSEVAAIEKLEPGTDFKTNGDWGILAKEVMQTARWVAPGRIADAAGDLDSAAPGSANRRLTWRGSESPRAARHGALVNGVGPGRRHTLGFRRDRRRCDCLNPVHRNP